MTAGDSSIEVGQVEFVSIVPGKGENNITIHSLSSEVHLSLNLERHATCLEVFHLVSVERDPSRVNHLAQSEGQFVFSVKR